MDNPPSPLPLPTPLADVSLEEGSCWSIVVNLDTPESVSQDTPSQRARVSVAEVAGTNSAEYTGNSREGQGGKREGG